MDIECFYGIFNMVDIENIEEKLYTKYCIMYFSSFGLSNYDSFSDQLCVAMATLTHGIHSKMLFVGQYLQTRI